MHSAERVDVKMRMGMAGEAGETRNGVTPLIFQAAGRRSMEPVQPESLFRAERMQEEEIVEDLRTQVKILQSKVEIVRHEARMEGRGEAAAEMATALETERRRIGETCARFQGDRERYFAEVEEEVVRLALGIAARVLHREARIDPLLLAASVRVALEKVAGEKGTVLRVPVSAVDAWRALFADASVVEVMGDEAMCEGDLALESQVGRVELGVPVQLEEIERGFFDLLQKRPA